MSNYLRRKLEHILHSLKAGPRECFRELLGRRDCRITAGRAQILPESIFTAEGELVFYMTKTITVVEMVSWGNPKEMFARAKDVHPIEPKAKKESVLKDRQSGVKRVFSRVDVGTSIARLNANPKIIDLVGLHVESTYKHCEREFKEQMREVVGHEVMKLREELGLSGLTPERMERLDQLGTKMREELDLSGLTPERMETLDRLGDARMIRCIVDAWLDRRDSKNLLGVAVKKVNASKEGKGDIVTNLVFEIKRLLKNKHVYD